MKMETKLHKNLVAQRANGSMLERLGASVSKALLALMLVLAYAVPAQATTRITYIHNDHLGTPQVMTDELGAVVWRADYRPFGEADVIVNSLGNDLRFPGQIYDEETGLHYNYFRDYDPSTGRYIESDPFGLKGGLNTYSYAEGNSIMKSDPTGLAVWLCLRALSNQAIPGNHSYLWNDKTSSCCGRVPNQDPIKDCREKGPNGDFCIKIAGSDGIEDKVMNCCSKRAKKDQYVPGRNDCFNTAEDCLTGNGLVVPNHPGRTGVCSSCYMSQDDVNSDIDSP